MERQQYKTNINAGVEKVYDTMLGKDTFKQWTSVFNPSSDFEGSWTKGSKILFTGLSKEGKKEGMVGKIQENIPYKFVSTFYLGVVDGDKEITEGPAVEAWAGGYENYTFEESNGITELTVDVDVNSEMLTYFNQTYPKALEKLKEICEK
ncbi:SRPBCC domain-containing protein [Desertivirga xinjiangensis]|uniref:SRPBCC domain-containing protein n=1 Tax=Desertivirga xinjiangensis TaxID=539206 RepID=UPI00210D8E04|nr:SRPBCC domain-containing protein [Pedobacter xinjiangensis]